MQLTQELLLEIGFTPYTHKGEKEPHPSIFRFDVNRDIVVKLIWAKEPILNDKYWVGETNCQLYINDLYCDMGRYVNLPIVETVENLFSLFERLITKNDNHPKISLYKLLDR
jgi:hypothetical protein